MKMEEGTPVDEGKSRIWSSSSLLPRTNRKVSSAIKLLAAKYDPTFHDHSEVQDYGTGQIDDAMTSDHNPKITANEYFVVKDHDEWYNNRGRSDRTTLVDLSEITHDTDDDMSMSQIGFSSSDDNQKYDPSDEFKSEIVGIQFCDITSYEMEELDKKKNRGNSNDVDEYLSGRISDVQTSLYPTSQEMREALAKSDSEDNNPDDTNNKGSCTAFQNFGSMDVHIDDTLRPTSYRFEVEREVITGPSRGLLKKLSFLSDDAYAMEFERNSAIERYFMTDKSANIKSSAMREANSSSSSSSSNKITAEIPHSRNPSPDIPSTTNPPTAAKDKDSRCFTIGIDVFSPTRCLSSYVLLLLLLL